MPSCLLITELHRRMQSMQRPALTSHLSNLSIASAGDSGSSSSSRIRRPRSAASGYFQYQPSSRSSLSLSPAGSLLNVPPAGLNTPAPASLRTPQVTPPLATPDLTADQDDVDEDELQEIDPQVKLWQLQHNCLEPLPRDERAPLIVDARTGKTTRSDQVAPPRLIATPSTSSAGVPLAHAVVRRGLLVALDPMAGHGQVDASFVMRSVLHALSSPPPMPAAPCSP